MSKLASFLRMAFEKKGQTDSAHLGDRTTYVGASDIAGCPRKAVLSKTTPEAFSVKTRIRFARGHAAEDLLASLFEAGGLKFERETEVIHPEFDFIRAHVDFLFRTADRIHAIEVKSVDGIPTEPYGSWVEQLHVQMGLLALRNPGVKIGGSIFVIDLNKGEWQEFNSFEPNGAVFNNLLEKGLHIWDAYTQGSIPRTQTSLLCGVCPHQASCPEYNLEGLPPLPDDVAAMAEHYLALNTEVGQIKRQADVIATALKEYAGESPVRATSESVLMVVNHIATSETVDSKKLKKDFPDIWEVVKKPKAGYARLEVSLIPEKKKTAKAA
ncbi:hypothetical protein [Geoalkalibacter halelectricus]|uniref:hypothetical protein n=1 Tax=Geoalkalibacter halelectricus TaxID=2847045 RepID=UPI00266EDEBE|nr:hypothetical protein [Geoalkalibacter halelectricus]MDO3380408.1 hypothetical protein [Geoalkalibacter halelectricus]